MIWTPEAHELEQALRARRAPTLFAPDVAEEFVLPAYDGYSLANVGSTVGALLGASTPCPSPPLAPQYWQGLSDGVQRVIVVVLDALGYLQLGQILEEQPNSIWARLAQRGILVAPGEFYGAAGAGHVRVAVVQPDDSLTLVAERLRTPR